MLNKYAYFPTEALHNGMEKIQIIKYSCKTQTSNQKIK